MWTFLYKQVQASLFALFLITLFIVTDFFYPSNALLKRYDFLFLMAIGFQVIVLYFKFETFKEFKVIIFFHILATGMELFKTSIGSWRYPEEFFFGIGQVPLFAGFMYSAVGSYLARMWSIFQFRFSNYPHEWQALLVVMLIYINFFSHHYIYDFRYIILCYVVILFWRTKVFFTINKSHNLPLLLSGLFVALLIWLAENICTYTGIWLYPSQQSGWQVVPLTKLVAWYLLMLLSFVLISLIHKSSLLPKRIKREKS